MSYAAVAPTRRVEPEQIATDTWLIHSAQDALGQPLVVYLNAMVIKGEEPVIIDTNTIANRKQWMDDVFGLVDPQDVKWIYLSHDDVDHTGNLEEAMTACPNATLVMSWPMHERHTNAFEFPIERCRWINDGESFSVGDRTLTAIRPPMYDSPTTRGLFDDKTGVYWGVDSFAAPMMNEPVSNVSELDPEFWAHGMTMFMHNVLCPWIGIVDEKSSARRATAFRTSAPRRSRPRTARSSTTTWLTRPGRSSAASRRRRRRPALTRTCCRRSSPAKHLRRKRTGVRKPPWGWCCDAGSCL
jgi:flavorubredoxin